MKNVKTLTAGLMMGVFVMISSPYALYAQAPGSVAEPALAGAENEFVTEMPDDTAPVETGETSPELVDDDTVIEPETVEPVLTTPAPATSNSTPTTTGRDPCPEPKTALGSTPDDLAKIQEDITRFTLCVQRAQLLERLNELATTNIETIDSALNLTVAGPEDDGNAIPGIMPNVSGDNRGNSAPPAAPSNMPAFGDLFSAEEEEPADVQASIMDSPPEPRRAAPATSSWEIREITGNGGVLSAQLIDANEMIVSVKAGEQLPDEGGSIAAITQTSVSISKDSKTIPLRWVQ